MSSRAGSMRQAARGGLAAACFVFAGTTAANAAHLDAFVATSGGQTVVGGYDFDSNQIFDTQIFEAELGLSGGQFGANEPGFVSGNPSPGTMPAGWSPLAGAGLDVSFDILSEPTIGLNLSYWDGSGAASFGAVADDEVLVVQQSGCFVCASAVANGSASDIAGFVIATTGAGGTIHQHPNFFLLGDAGATDTASEGVYLLALSLLAEGATASTPMYIVFAALDPANYPELTPEEFEAFVDESFLEPAVSYVETTLVPEPGTFLLLCAGLAGLGAGGRRKRSRLAL